MKEKKNKTTNNPNPISYEAKKKVEQDLDELANKAKRDYTATLHQEQYNSDKEKIYCKKCQYRRNKNCINHDVLVYHGNFSTDALECGTKQFMSIFTANSENDCQFYKEKEIKDLKQFFKKFLIFIFLGVILAISGLIGLIYLIINSLTV